jgi:hypothetical protein
MPQATSYDGGASWEAGTDTSVDALAIGLKQNFTFDSQFRPARAPMVALPGAEPE